MRQSELAYLVAATRHHVGDVVKCAKDAARYHLRPGRPILADHYDKRFCVDAPTTRNRANYVDRHNPRLGLPARPFAFHTDVDDYLRRLRRSTTPTSGDTSGARPDAPLPVS